MIRSNFLRRLFYNWHVKLISLALALILWKYVDSLNEKERYLNVKLIVKNVPKGYLIVNNIPNYIRIMVKGKDEYLSLIDSSDFKAYINLEERTTLSSDIPVRIEKINVPRNIIVKDVNPSTIAVKIEKLEEKSVKVEPVIVGKPKKGYLVEDIIITPNKVKIGGPSSEIGSVEEIYTKEININNLSLTASFNVPLVVKQFKNVKIIGDDHVNVVIKIVEKYNLVQLDNIELKFLNLDKEYDISPDKVFINAKVKIPMRLNNLITKDDIMAFVDFKGLMSVGKVTLPIQIKAIRKGVEIIGYTPKEVELEIKRVHR